MNITKIGATKLVNDNKVKKKPTSQEKEIKIYKACSLPQQIPFSKSHRVFATLGARHDQARVQSVALLPIVPLPRLVHMCSHTMDLLVAHTDSGFYANSIVFKGLGG